MYSESEVLINFSTTCDNTAMAGPGGGGPGGGIGGGIYNLADLTLQSSTIASNLCTGGNSDSGGGIHNNGTLAIYSCTIAGNQAHFAGGLAGNATIGNTLLADNTAATAGPNGSGNLNSVDDNFIRSFGGSTFGATTHVILAQDPLLGPLSHNDGPTRAMALLPGSPAIDQGTNLLFSTGQSEPVVMPR